MQRRRVRYHSTILQSTRFMHYLGLLILHLRLIKLILATLVLEELALETGVT